MTLFKIALSLVVGALSYHTTSKLITDATVELADNNMPKTVMIYVRQDVDVMRFKRVKDSLVLEKATASVVMQGSGVFVSNAGHVLSCQHLIDGKVTGIKVRLYSGEVQDAIVVSTPWRNDLALLKIAKYDTPYVRLANPHSLQVGQAVMVIGNPLGLDFTVTTGIISQLNRDIMGRYNLLQTDAPVNPGNSGGPVLNYKGELVGIVSMKAPYSDGIGLAVSAGQILEFLTQYKKAASAI